jgi:hypothetical protein
MPSSQVECKIKTAVKNYRKCCFLGFPPQLGHFLSYTQTVLLQRTFVLEQRADESLSLVVLKKKEGLIIGFFQSTRQGELGQANESFQKHAPAGI